MKRIFSRLLGLAACLSGGGLAASGCTSVYALNATSINWVDAQSGVVTGTYTTAFTAINGAALNPVTGELYFIDRSAATTNTLYRYNPQTPATAPVLVGPVTIPTRNGETATSVNVGASFDNSTGTPRLYLMYGNYVLQEVNPATGAVVRNININLANGAQNTTTAISNSTITNGDIVFVGSTLYALLDGEQAGVTGSGGMFYANFGTVPATGTTALSSASVVRVTSGGTNVARGVYNGISYDPVLGRMLISTGGTTGGTALLNTGTGAVTALSSAASLTDMTDCGVTPDSPTVSKSFSPQAVIVTQGSRVTLTFGNTNPTPFYLRSAVTDTLPSGIVVAAAPNATTTCTASDGTAAAVTATAGSGSVTLASGTRIPGGGCTLNFNVTANTSGSKVNIIAAAGIVSTVGTNAAAGSATLTVNATVTGAVQKTQRNVTQAGTAGTANINGRPGDIIEYCITATHPGVGTADATVADLKDTLATPLTLVPGVYGGRDVQLTKGATVTTLTSAAGDDAATLSGRTLTVNILPWNSSNTTAKVCFQARVG